VEKTVASPGFLILWNIAGLGCPEQSEAAYRTVLLERLLGITVRELTSCGKQWQVYNGSNHNVKRHVNEYSEIERNRSVWKEPQCDAREYAVPCPALAALEWLSRQKDNKHTPSRDSRAKHAINPRLKRLDAFHSLIAGPKDCVDKAIKYYIKKPCLIREGKQEPEDGQNPSHDQEPLVPKLL